MTETSFERRHSLSEISVPLTVLPRNTSILTYSVRVKTLFQVEACRCPPRLRTVQSEVDPLREGPSRGSRSRATVVTPSRRPGRGRGRVRDTGNVCYRTGSPGPIFGGGTETKRIETSYQRVGTVITVNPDVLRTDTPDGTRNLRQIIVGTGTVICEANTVPFYRSL